MHNNTIYEWILPAFTVSGRAKSLMKMEPYLSALVQPGNNVLDLCCGSGPMSFWFELEENHFLDVFRLVERTSKS